ncbi:MAG: uracil-DNA glycosylase family protein [Paracoccaceae bacterium]
MSERAQLLAALEWQIELGADLCLEDAPVDRYAAEVEARRNAEAAKAAPPDPVAETAPPPPLADAAPPDLAQVTTLAELDADLAALGHDWQAGGAPLPQGGAPGCDVLLILDAPSVQDETAGRLLSGETGALIERLARAAGLDALPAASLSPACPPGGAGAEAGAFAPFVPFLQARLALAAPRVTVPMGPRALQALTGLGGLRQRIGTPIRDGARTFLPLPAPASLHRPDARRALWAALLTLADLLAEPPEAP